MTVIIMISMFMSIVPTTMAEAEEKMFEEVITVNTEVASKVFINKVFNIINNNNNQQSSKDIFMKENEDEEEEVSCFDNLPLLNNNNEPSMTTRPSLLWWFTKDVLRRTTEGRTQLDEEDNED